MIISVRSGSSGWSHYVLYGTERKPRDVSKVEIIDGDLDLGDKISDNNKGKRKYYTFVLGFKGKPEHEEMVSAYNDFKKEFFHGFSEDEYHIDAVIHRDTDDYHIHARVPQENLKTSTNLQLYYHKVDMKRKELIQDYISLKHGFEIARETNREIIKENAHEHIEKWREERGQKKFDFKNKKNKAAAEKQINQYILDLHQSDMIEKHDDIAAVLEEMDLKVERFGEDLTKDFSYVTVSNDTGKLRVKGEIYNARFWENNREDRRTQIDDNKRAYENGGERNERLKDVSRKLKRANTRRFKLVEERFRSARARADQKLQEFEHRSEHKDNNTNVVIGSGVGLYVYDHVPGKLSSESKFSTITGEPRMDHTSGVKNVSGRKDVHKNTSGKSSNRSDKSKPVSKNKVRPKLIKLAHDSMLHEDRLKRLTELMENIAELLKNINHALIKAIRERRIQNEKRIQEIEKNDKSRTDVTERTGGEREELQSIAELCQEDGGEEREALDFDPEAAAREPEVNDTDRGEPEAQSNGEPDYQESIFEPESEHTGSTSKSGDHKGQSKLEKGPAADEISDTSDSIDIGADPIDAIIDISSVGDGALLQASAIAHEIAVGSPGELKEAMRQGFRHMLRQ